MSALKQLLIHRLKDKGMTSALIPGYIRSLSNTLFLAPHMNLAHVKSRLHYLGWTDVELDYYTFQLAVECLEAEGLKTLEYKPVNWYEKNFMFQHPGASANLRVTPAATV